MGKDKKQKRKHKDVIESDVPPVTSCYGPALPPTAPMSRELWMSEGGCSVFDKMTYSKDDIKNDKKKEKTPEYDYSAPGLHIMTKSPVCTTESNSSRNRLYSKHRSSNDDDTKNTTESNSSRNRLYSKHRSSHDDDTKNNIERMKARFKRHNKNKADAFIDEDKAKDRRSKFKTSYSDYRPAGSGSGDKSRSCKHRSSSDSPKRSNKTKKRSRSPQKEQKDHVRNSMSPEVNPTSSKINLKECKLQETVVASSSKSQEDGNDKAEKCASDEKTITDDDLNKLSARIVKAEIMDNSEKVCKLKKKLEELKKVQRSQNSKLSVKEETVILTSVDRKGNVRPIAAEDTERPIERKRRKEKTMNTHSSSGVRDKYFPDDNNKELSDLLREEKSVNQLDHDELFMKYAGKLSKMSQDRQSWTLDDMFETNIAKIKSKSSKDVDKIVSENIKEHKRLESCYMCLEKCSKDSIVHIGKTLYVRVPPNKSLARNHCQVVPITHIVSTVNGDEDFWAELSTLKSTITKKFSAHKLDVVFMELAQRLGNRKHILIDCVPVPIEESALLPAYFKKAILECDVEWSNNKKLVDTRVKGLRKSIPQGLPYFSVEFGTDGGYAHVIEDESLFKRYFGLEIVGGILDCDVNLWRHPDKESDEGLKYKKRIFEKLSIEF